MQQTKSLVGTPTNQPANDRSIEIYLQHVSECNVTSKYRFNPHRLQEIYILTLSKSRQRGISPGRSERRSSLVGRLSAAGRDEMC